MSKIKSHEFKNRRLSIIHLKWLIPYFLWRRRKYKPVKVVGGKVLLKNGMYVDIDRFALLSIPATYEVFSKRHNSIVKLKITKYFIKLIIEDEFKHARWAVNNNVGRWVGEFKNIVRENKTEGLEDKS